MLLMMSHASVLVLNTAQHARLTHIEIGMENVSAMKGGQVKFAISTHRYATLSATIAVTVQLHTTVTGV